jgi:5-methylcytosine-specific restriction enzyme A
MPTYLLTWKPRRFLWLTLDADVRRLLTSGTCEIRWSAGVNKHITTGDRVFLLRQGADEAGIMGAGRVIRGSYIDKHWDSDRASEDAVFVRIKMDSLLHPERDGIMARESLNFGPNRLWSSQSSGITIPADAAKRLEQRWSTHLQNLQRAPHLLAEEINDMTGFPEGAKQLVVINRYERDPRNRAECIAHHGYRCSVCRFDFTQTYGELGREYIHVHHLVGLATRKGKRQKINPRNDLRPICPNCHAMIHRGGYDRTIEDVREALRRDRH